MHMPFCLAKTQAITPFTFKPLSRVVASVLVTITKSRVTMVMYQWCFCTRSGISRVTLVRYQWCFCRRPAFRQNLKDESSTSSYISLLGHHIVLCFTKQLPHWTNKPSTGRRCCRSFSALNEPSIKLEVNGLVGSTNFTWLNILFLPILRIGQDNY